MRERSRWISGNCRESLMGGRFSQRTPPEHSPGRAEPNGNPLVTSAAETTASFKSISQMHVDTWPPGFQGCRNLSALHRGFPLESKLLAKPSFSQKSFSSNSQEKEEDRIPPILFWADYFPLGINELSTMRSSCLVQITKSHFCFTRDNSDWCGSQLFGDEALCLTRKKECHCYKLDTS